MPRSFYGEMLELSDEELLRRINADHHTTIGPWQYVQEWGRRLAQRQADRMERLTLHVRDLTIAIAILTVVNVLLVGLSLFGPG